MLVNVTPCFSSFSASGAVLFERLVAVGKLMSPNDWPTFSVL